MNALLKTVSDIARRSSLRARIIAAAVVVVVIAALWSLIAQAHHRAQPVYVLEMLDRVHGPADVERYNDFFTARGKGVWLYLIAKGEGQPKTDSKVVLSDPVIAGDVCDVAGSVGDVSFTLRLRKAQRWQFDDMYFHTAGQKEIGLWVSYMKDHPVLTYFQLNWKELGGAFLKGFAIGAGL